MNDCKQRKQLLYIAALVLFGIGPQAQGADPVELPDIHVIGQPVPVDGPCVP